MVICRVVKERWWKMRGVVVRLRWWKMRGVVVRLRWVAVRLRFVAGG